MTDSRVSMFDGFEVGNAISKAEFEEAVPPLRVDLLNAQFDLEHADFSVLVLLAGDDRKGVNEVLDILHEWMDARYLNTHVFLLPKHEEREFPAHWRYWRAMPPKGRIGIFAGAWPARALVERLLEGGDDALLTRRIEHSKVLERCLAENGTVLLKFWLHSGKEAKKKQLKKAKKDPDSEPYISEQDQGIYEIYDAALPVMERIVRETSTGLAPWEIVESADSRYRNLTIGRKILAAVRERLAVPPSPVRERPPVPETSLPHEAGALDRVDLRASLERDEYKQRLGELQHELNSLVREAEKRFATVLAFEGWDAAGKGGVIRRLTHGIFAHSYRVIPVAAPTDEEQARHYLWRFWRHVPRDGSMVIFDRTWYGRVLVERVEGLAAPEEWRRAYEEINDFESQLVDHGMVFCKFWLHIDKDEQLARFQAREKTGYKKYKITEEDYRNRDRWEQYEAAVNEMVARTSSEAAPWHLVAANDKRWARIQVLETVAEALKKRLKQV